MEGISAAYFALRGTEDFAPNSSMQEKNSRCAG